MPTTTLLSSLPKDAEKILLVLFLSFLVGLEREEHKASSDNYGFGGVRTFPLIGLLGYVLALVSGVSLILPGIGLAVVAAFLWQSYRYKLEHSPLAGMTSEISGLLIYSMGVLVFQEQYWIATTITVIGVVLLELKAGLEESDETGSGRRNSDLREISIADGRDSACGAERDLRAVRIQSLQSLGGGGGGERDFLRQLSFAEGHARAWRHHAERAAGRTLFFNTFDCGAGEARALRASPTFIFRSNAAGLGNDVRAADRAAGDFQHAVAAATLYSVYRSGRHWRAGWMGLGVAARKRRRGGSPRGASEESAGNERGAFVRRVICGDAGGDALCAALLGARRILFACGNNGADGHHSVHHEPDAIGAGAYAAGIGRGGNHDCRIEQ